jgi:hypothetical protein
VKCHERNVRKNHIFIIITSQTVERGSLNLLTVEPLLPDKAGNALPTGDVIRGKFKDYPFLF